MTDLGPVSKVRLMTTDPATMLTAAQVAERLGVARERISEWESGRIVPSAAARVGIEAAIASRTWTACPEPTDEDAPTLLMEIRPEDAGQIIEIAYGDWYPWHYRRTIDRGCEPGDPGWVTWHRRQWATD